MPKDPDEELVEKYKWHRLRGLNQREAAGRVGLSAPWASRFEDAGWHPDWRDVEVPAEALALLDDFEGFRAHYFGHISKPWMVDFAEAVRALLLSPDPEHAVFNVAPGGGKSTVVQDVFAWLLCRDRSIRTLYGADTAGNASKATGLIQDYFETQAPIESRPQLVALGQAVRADRVLVHDFGPFKPDDGLWRRTEFTIQGAAAVKEASVTAFGYGSGVLGNRFELIAWDDLVTEDVTRSPTRNQQLIDDWDGGLGESRLEPFSNGLLFLVGQRIGPRDLYRHCLDKTFIEFVDGQEVEPKLYTHIMFPAHFDENCSGDAGHDPKTARSWPHGCLLDHERLPWTGPKGLAAKRRNSQRTYDIQFQQLDGTNEGALIERPWIFGGMDSDGIERPGCLNRERSMGEPPDDWSPKDCLSVITVDPSGTRYWAIQWWLVNHAINTRALMRAHDVRIDASQLLDWDGDGHTGYLEKLWQESCDTGYPVTYVVVEVNAAQRYLTQMNTTKRWRESRKVSVVPHTTSTNKLDPNLGLDILKEPYRAGWFDLPYEDRLSRIATEVLAAQVCGDHERNDQLMACWFMELWQTKLKPSNKPIADDWRPSWMKRTSRREAAIRGLSRSA